MKAARGVWRPPWLALLVVGLCSAAQQRQSQYNPRAHRVTNLDVSYASGQRDGQPPTSSGLRRNDGYLADDNSGIDQKYSNEKLLRKKFGSESRDEKENNLEPSNRDRLRIRDLGLIYFSSSNISQPPTRFNISGNNKPSLFLGLTELDKVSNKPRRSYPYRMEGSPYHWRHNSSSDRGSLSLGSYLMNNILKEPSRQRSNATRGIPNNRPLRSPSQLSSASNNIAQRHSISSNLNKVYEVEHPLGYVELARREIIATRFHPIKNSQVPTREHKPSLFDPIIAELKREAEEAKKWMHFNMSKENSVYEVQSNEKLGNNPWLQTVNSGMNHNEWHSVPTSGMGHHKWHQVKFSNIGSNHWHQFSTSGVGGDQWQHVPASSMNNNQWHLATTSGIGSNQWHLATTSGIGSNQWHLATTTGLSRPSSGAIAGQQGELGENEKRPQPSFLEGSSRPLLSSFGSLFPSDVRGWSVSSNWTFSSVPLTDKSSNTNTSRTIYGQPLKAHEVFPLPEGLPLPARAATLLDQQDPEVSPGLFQGDIALQSPEEIARFRVGVNWDVFPHLRWPNATVPYIISPLYLPEEHHLIQTSIVTLNFLSCVRFVPWDGVAKDYLLIWPVEAPKGCWSYVGRRGGQQVVSLQRPDAASTRCFGSIGKPLHELLHALGVFHEHTRADRDEYVEVLVNNIVPEFVTNFQKQSLVNTTYAFAYDYDSVMHYGSHFFSKNGVVPTIRTLDPLAHIGQREMISKRDCLKLNALYGCLEQGTDQLDMYRAFCNTLAL